MILSIEKEINELHAFFKAWYGGTLENSDSVFFRLANVLAPEYTLITSDGYVLNREQVLSFLRSAHAVKPDLDIWVKNIQLRLDSGDLFIATYEEHGITEGKVKSTLITAILRKNPATPNNLEWVHIHEVKLPASS